MLDEDEFAIAYKLYGEAFPRIKSGMSIEEGFQPLMEYYKSTTGFDGGHHNAIMHHRLAIYGPACEQCGKPLRTPRAAFCAACGKYKS